MSKKLFVGGLSWGTDDQGLREAFEQFGEVIDAKVITDRETGRSRGFGFVEMATDEQGRAACEQLNQRDFEGRRLTVNEARPQERHGGGGGYSGQRGGGGGGGRQRRDPRW